MKAFNIRFLRQGDKGLKVYTSEDILAATLEEAICLAKKKLEKDCWEVVETYEYPYSSREIL